MLGPVYALGELPGIKLNSEIVPRLLNRFGILEMHGGATEESCRVMNDGKARGCNGDSANSATHRPADHDLVATMAGRVAELFPPMPAAGFPSFFEFAHRRVPSEGA